MVTKVTLLWIHLPTATFGESVHYYRNYYCAAKNVSAWNANRMGHWAYAIKSSERVLSPFGDVRVLSDGQIIPLGVKLK